MAVTTLTLGAVSLNPIGTSPIVGEAVVGDPPQWSDGSDASYAYIIWEPAGTLSVRAFAPVTVPITGQVESVRVFMRAKADPAFGADPDPVVALITTNLLSPSAPFVEGGPFLLAHDGAAHEGWLDATLYNEPGADWLADPDLRVYVYNGPSHSRLWIYEVRVEVTYTPTETIRPATRMFPRDDALGLSSAPRLVPPPKARRVVGGYL